MNMWLGQYNNERTHSGKYCYGKTPMRTFMDSIPLAREKLFGHDESDGQGARVTPSEFLYDILASTYMVEVVPPWFSNTGSQVAEGVRRRFRDNAALLGLRSFSEMSGH